MGDESEFTVQRRAAGGVCVVAVTGEPDLLSASAVRAADRDGFTFTVVRGSREVQRLFELVGLADRLTLVDVSQEDGRDGSPAA